MIIQFIEYLQARLGLVVRVCYGLLALAVVYGLGVDKHHAHTWVEQHIPGFWALFGLAACGILIGFARWYGLSGIQTREEDHE